MKRRGVIGEIYGQLTLLRPVQKREATRTRLYWDCRCTCGNRTIVDSASLYKGAVKSCGCFRRQVTRDRSYKHGARINYHRTPEYQAWEDAKKRCYAPRNPRYPWYGARGIAMYRRWRTDFAAFLRHIGHRPTPVHSLDRIDNDGNYEPGNVRWATRREQALNTSRSKHR